MSTSLTYSELIDKEQEDGIAFGPFHRDWLLRFGPRRVPERIKRNLLLAQKYPNLVAIQQGFDASVSGMGSSATAAFGAINTSASELHMLGATQAIINQYCAIPYTEVYAGKIFTYRMGGTYGNTSTPTMIFTPRWGTSTTPATNTTLGANAAWTSITGTTGLPYRIEFEFQIRTSPPGATVATGWGIGKVHLGIPVTSSQICADILIGATAATIDGSGQGASGCGLQFTLTWSASSVSNTSTCQYCTGPRSMN